MIFYTKAEKTFNRLYVKILTLPDRDYQLKASVAEPEPLEP
jgi:hypothetical protein